MKAAFVGGTRGYRSAVYRPGSGWTVTDRRSVSSRRLRVLKKDRYVSTCPLAVARRRHPGLRTKTLVVSGVIVVATVLTVVLSGGSRF